MKMRKDRWKKWIAGTGVFLMILGCGAVSAEAKEPPVTVNLLMFG